MYVCHRQRAMSIVVSPIIRERAGKVACMASAADPAPVTTYQVDIAAHRFPLVMGLRRCLSPRFRLVTFRTEAINHAIQVRL